MSHWVSATAIFAFAACLSSPARSQPDADQPVMPGGIVRIEDAKYANFDWAFSPSGRTMYIVQQRRDPKDESVRSFRLLEAALENLNESARDWSDRLPASVQSASFLVGSDRRASLFIRTYTVQENAEGGSLHRFDTTTHTSSFLIPPELRQQVGQAAIGVDGGLMYYDGMKIWKMLPVGKTLWWEPEVRGEEHVTIDQFTGDLWAYGRGNQWVTTGPSHERQSPLRRISVADRNVTEIGTIPGAVNGVYPCSAVGKVVLLRGTWAAGAVSADVDLLILDVATGGLRDWGRVRVDRWFSGEWSLDGRYFVYSNRGAVRIIDLAEDADRVVNPGIDPWYYNVKLNHADQTIWAFSTDSWMPRKLGSTRHDEGKHGVH